MLNCRTRNVLGSSMGGIFVKKVLFAPGYFYCLTQLPLITCGFVYTHEGDNENICFPVANILLK